MHTTVFFVLGLSLLAHQATLSLGVRTEIPGRCTDVCSSDVEAAFFSCVDEIDRGCALRLCDSMEGAVECALKSGIPDEIFTGEEVTFSDIMVSRSMTTNLGILGLLPKSDIYFLIDGTGSMGAAINAFRKSFIRLTNALGSLGDFAYGVGVFRDETELDMGFRHIQEITTDVEVAKAGVDALRSRGGEDAEEANLVALYKIATGDFANWREGASRVVLLFGDAVGHEPTCFDDVVLNRSVVTRALRNADITLHAIGTSSATLNDPTTEFGCGNGKGRVGQTTFITTRTGGNMASLAEDNVENVFDTFSEVLSTPSTIVEVAEDNCRTGINVVMTDPPIPGPLRADQKVKLTFRVRRRVCGSNPFECSISFKSGEFVSEPLTIKVVDPVGCPT